MVYCVTNKKQLDDVLSVASKDPVLPWVIGHNENGYFISAHGERVGIDDLHYEAVVLSCSLYDSPVKNTALRTTINLDFQSAMTALGDALATQGRGDTFINAVWDSYGQDVKRREATAKKALMIVSPVGVMICVYAAHQGQASPTAAAAPTK